MWTVIGQAKTGSRDALESLLSRYRTPLLAYLRHRGLSDHDAEDLVQEVFIQICADGFLAKADRAKGKFRTLLLRVTQHLMSSEFRKQYSQKRGSGKRALSIEEIPEGADPEVEDNQFNELWTKNLLRLALEKLQRETARLKVPYHQVLLLRYLEGRSPSEIARTIGCKTHDVDNYLYHGKQRLRRHLAEIAREYCSSEQEHEGEVEMLRRYLS